MGVVLENMEDIVSRFLTRDVQKIVTPKMSLKKLSFVTPATLVMSHSWKFVRAIAVPIP